MDNQLMNLVLVDQVAEYLSLLSESPRTQQTYTLALKAFLKFLAGSKRDSKESKKSANPLTFGVIDTDVLLKFQAWLVSEDYSRFSQRTYGAGVVAFLMFALSKDILPPSFSLEKARAKLKHVSRRSSYPIPRPDPALPHLIAYFDQLVLPEVGDEKTRRQRLQILRNRAFVHLLYSSAARLAEVAALNRKDVADGRRKEAVVIGKGDKERFIYITPEARAAIAAYARERKDTYEPLFISHGRKYGARLSHFMLKHLVRQASKKLGIDVSPHDFRHYRARQMLEQGAPLEAIQEILGHSDISTTRRVYAHYSKPAIRAIFERTTLSPDKAAAVRPDESSDD